MGVKTKVLFVCVHNSAPQPDGRGIAKQHGG